MGKEKDDQNGDWKLCLYRQLSTIDLNLQAIVELLEKLTERSETQRKLSDAGKKSAEARRLKFGSARPGDAMLKAFAGPPQMDLLTEEQIERPFGEPVREGVRAARKKSVKPPTAGSQVWQIYELAYQSRWTVAPLRNARANRHCAELAGLVGIAGAMDLARYYVSRNDARYVNAKHPLGLLIMDAQKLSTEHRGGCEMTMRDAQRHETHSQTDRAIRQYVDQNPEPVREQVHVKEVKNAASRSAK